MSSSQRYQTPSRASSSVISSRNQPSSASSLQGSSSRGIFSTPEPGNTRQASSNPSHSTQSNRNSSHASSRTVSAPSLSSPQLPAHPHRQRLSMRPRHRTSSAPIHEDEQNETPERLLSPDDADALNETIMAIDIKSNGNLGCAYYIASQETLYLLEDVAMASSDLVETLLLHANPTTVLISARAPDSLADNLERGAQGVDGNRGELHVVVQLTSRH